MSPRWVALGLCLGTALFLWKAPSSASTNLHSQQTPSSIPKKVGPWLGKASAVDERTFEILETRDVIAMEYQRAGGEPVVWLAQVAGFGNRAAFHPPEICYVGSHMQILEREKILVKVDGKAQRLMRLLVGQGNQRFEAWYWFTAQGRVSPSYYEQQWWLALATLRGKRPSGTLVRISTPQDDPLKARQRLEAFLVSWQQTHHERTL
ncbi:MAG: EpsI family protein [Candidatus Omnitrophica bacterium]|nr:EpsI family protein [Candidatus Omnitrophota bacterium]